MLLSNLSYENRELKEFLGHEMPPFAKQGYYLGTVSLFRSTARVTDIFAVLVHTAEITACLCSGWCVERVKLKTGPTVLRNNQNRLIAGWPLAIYLLQ